MQPVPQTRRVSKNALWAGYIMSALPVLMLLFSAGMKIARPPAVVVNALTEDRPARLATAGQ